jgi:hypothetical protein
MPDTDPKKPSGRDASGHFAPGNKIGQGNPLLRRMDAYRKALANALTPEMIGGIIRAMAKAALQGDVAAGKLVLSYACGRVREAEEGEDRPIVIFALPSVELSATADSDVLDEIKQSD